MAWNKELNMGTSRGSLIGQSQIHSRGLFDDIPAANRHANQCISIHDHTHNTRHAYALYLAMQIGKAMYET